MLPELTAERQMLAIEAASLPHMTPQSRTQILSRWTRRAQGATRHRTLGEALATLPIPVEFVPKQEAPGERKPRTRKPRPRR